MGVDQARHNRFARAVDDVDIGAGGAIVLSDGSNALALDHNGDLFVGLIGKAVD